MCGCQPVDVASDASYIGLPRIRLCCPGECKREMDLSVKAPTATRLIEIHQLYQTDHTYWLCVMHVMSVLLCRVK